MNRGGSEEIEGRPVPSSAVPLVGIEAVLGKPAVIPNHDAVAGHLGHDRGGRHRGRDHVALSHTQTRQLEAPKREAVGEDELGIYGEPSKGSLQEAEIRAVKPRSVDPPGHGPADRDRGSMLNDAPVHPLALPRRENLGVLKSIEVEIVGKHDGRRNQRTGQGPPPGLIDPGHDAESSLAQLPLVVPDVL